MSAVSVKAMFSTLVPLSQNPSEWHAKSLSTTIVFGTLGIVLCSFFLLRTRTNGKIYDLGGIPLVIAWTFFTKRWDFIRGHFANTGGKMYRFRVLQHRVIALTGEQSRKIFFNNHSLDISEGYRILLGGIPNLEDIDISKEFETKRQEEIKRILMLFRSDRVAEILPTLLHDLNQRILGWKKEGKMDPFNEVYDLVFQMTVRLATCRELAEDKAAVTQLSGHYWNLEKSGTPVSVLLPWFPGSAKKRKGKATMALYRMLGSYVKLRRNASTPTIDTIDHLIGQGLSDNVVISTIMAVVFAGVVNTGVNACWLLLHLGANPTWKARAINEYAALVDKHTDTISTEPLHKRLAAVPISAWENELPSIDLIIRENVRITTPAAALRRNLVKEFMVDDVVIKPGDFLLYSMGGLHMDPNIYPDPSKFDPNRYVAGRAEDRKEAVAFVGWGAGRHPCAGMKIATLELKLILALMLLGYEYELVDGSGKSLESLPQPDRNDLHHARPLGDPCYLKYKRVIDD